MTTVSIVWWEGVWECLCGVSCYEGRIDRGWVGYWVSRNAWRVERVGHCRHERLYRVCKPLEAMQSDAIADHAVGACTTSPALPTSTWVTGKSSQSPLGRDPCQYYWTRPNISRVGVLTICPRFIAINMTMDVFSLVYKTKNLKLTSKWMFTITVAPKTASTQIWKSTYEK